MTLDQTEHCRPDQNTQNRDRKGDIWASLHLT